MMMKKENCLQYFVWMFSILLALQIQGCNSSELDYYEGNRGLYFERYRFASLEEGYMRSDTVKLVLSHYPGVNEIRHPFKILLIGDLLSEDTEYDMKRIDSLSTATEDMVSLSDKLLFKKGVVADSLWVTIHKDKVKDEKEYCVVYQLVDNENFGLGYSDCTIIKVWFSNSISAPLWWNDEVVNIFLGEWSQEKFEALVMATGILTFEGLSATEKRLYSLQLKHYIEENNLPMTVPAY